MKELKNRALILDFSSVCRYRNIEFIDSFLLLVYCIAESSRTEVRWSRRNRTIRIENEYFMCFIDYFRISFQNQTEIG